MLQCYAGSFPSKLQFFPFFNAACAGSFTSVLYRVLRFNAMKDTFVPKCFTEKDFKVFNQHLSLSFFMSCAEE